MGKKCVQLVQMLREKMCTSLIYAQALVQGFYAVCTKVFLPLTFPTTIHMLFSPSLILRTAALYTVSTKPTITTICLENIRQEKTVKRSLV